MIGSFYSYSCIDSCIDSFIILDLFILSDIYVDVFKRSLRALKYLFMYSSSDYEYLIFIRSNKVFSLLIF